MPKGYQLIKFRIVFDVKRPLKQKARIVAHGDVTDPPREAAYSGVASLQSLRIVCLLTELNGLKLTGGDVGNAYLEACTSEKAIGRSLIGDRESVVRFTYVWCKVSCKVC